MHIEETTPPAIIPASIELKVLWVDLDSESARYFISSDAIKTLKLKVVRHGSREIFSDSERGQSPDHADL